MSNATDYSSHLDEPLGDAPFSVNQIAVPLLASKELPDGQVLEVDALADLQAWLEKPTAPDALRLLTGPEGSGRTTTALRLAAAAPTGTTVRIATNPADRLSEPAPWFPEDHRDAPWDELCLGDVEALANSIDESSLRMLVIVDDWYCGGSSGRGTGRQLVKQLTQTLETVNAQGLRMQVLLVGNRVHAPDVIQLQLRPPGRETATRLHGNIQKYLPKATCVAPRGRLIELLRAMVATAGVQTLPQIDHEADLLLNRLQKTLSASFTPEAAWAWLRQFGEAPPSYPLHMALRRAVADLPEKQQSGVLPATLSRWSDGLPVQIALPHKAGTGYIMALANTQLGILSVLQAYCLATGKPQKPARTPSLGAYLNRLMDYHDLTDYLGGLDLSEAELDGFDFSGFDLRGTCFAGANLRGARFREALLAGADLSKADLTETDLRHADLEGANLRGARLTLARLDGVDFGNVHLEQADLSEHDFSGQSFERANLEGAIFRKANLREVNLRYAHLEGADLREADLTDAKLQDAVLIGADLRGANLEDANCKGARLTSARLEDANVQGAILRKADLRNTVLEKR